MTISAFDLPRAQPSDFDLPAAKMLHNDAACAQHTESSRMADHLASGNCEIAQLNNCAGLNWNREQGLSEELSDQTTAYGEREAIDSSRRTSLETRSSEPASIVGAYPSPANIFSTPDSHSHILLPMASPIFKPPAPPTIGGGKSPRSSHRPGSRGSSRSRWSATATPLSPKPKFSKPKA